MTQRANLSSQELLKELKAAITSSCSVKSAGGDRTRHFARHHLKMPGEQFKRVRQWFKDPESMTAGELELVHSVLKKLNTAEQPPAMPAPVPVARGHVVVREVVDHSISTMNSLAGLLTRTGVNRYNILEGDRKQMQSVLQRICATLGMPVRFSEGRP